MDFNEFYEMIEKLYCMMDNVEIYHNALHTSITVEYDFLNRRRYDTYRVKEDNKTWCLVDKEC